jgi:hypothetical protein
MIAFILNISGQVCFARNTDTENYNKREDEYNIFDSKKNYAIFISLVILIQQSSIHRLLVMFRDKPFFQLYAHTSPRKKPYRQTKLLCAFLIVFLSPIYQKQIHFFSCKTYKAIGSAVYDIPFVRSRLSSSSCIKALRAEITRDEENTGFFTSVFIGTRLIFFVKERSRSPDSDNPILIMYVVLLSQEDRTTFQSNPPV